MDADRRWALAWQYDQTAARLPCGCYRDEASGVENDDRHAAIPRVCHIHRAVGEAAEARRNSDGGSMHGVWWQIESD